MIKNTIYLFQVIILFEFNFSIKSLTGIAERIKLLAEDLLEEYTVNKDSDIFSWINE